MSEESHGLLDEDPALDCILFEEMQKDEQRRGQGPKGGCLGLLLLAAAPAAAVVHGLSVLI